MAAQPINVIIDRSRLSLEAGTWQLIWGDSTNSQTPFNPQALPTQEVIVSVNPNPGGTVVYLPPTSDQPSNFVKLWIGKVTANQDFITILPSGNDTISGKPSFQIENQYSWYQFQNLNGTDWTCVGTGK